MGANGRNQPLTWIELVMVKGEQGKEEKGFFACTLTTQNLDGKLSSCRITADPGDM